MYFSLTQDERILPNRSACDSIIFCELNGIVSKIEFFSSSSVFDVNWKEEVFWRWLCTHRLSYLVSIISYCSKLMVLLSLYKLFWISISSVIRMRVSILPLVKIFLAKKSKELSGSVFHIVLWTLSMPFSCCRGLAMIKICLKHAIDEMCDWRNRDHVKNKLN